MFDDLCFQLGEEGDAALRTLLVRLDLQLEPDVDLDAFEAELHEGVELIATFYPDVRSNATRNAISEAVKEMLGTVGITEWSYH